MSQPTEPPEPTAPPKRPKRSFRIALAIVVVSIAIVISVTAYFVHLALVYPDTLHDGTGKEVEVEIKSGMGVASVASLLAEKGVVEKPTWFRIFVMSEADQTKIKPGKYVIKDNLTPRDVLEIIITGVKEVTVSVTLPEGMNMLEYFALFDQKKVANAKELEKLARDHEFLNKHGISGETAEGYLFPDTYKFRVGEKPAVVLDRLITHQHEVWNTLLAKHARDVGKLKERLAWSDRDVLILASIVEKEAVDPAERTRIAQVFVNRLTFSSFNPKRLETDPTIRYGCTVPLVQSEACKVWKHDRLHRAQLDDKDNAYNTYQHEGLPPGPISNPGRGSIEATMTPDGSDFLFFVAKDARNHVFSRSIDEHKRNVEKYMK